MERSENAGTAHQPDWNLVRPLPDSASLHPGYGIVPPALLNPWHLRYICRRI
jgi:hypothetical protein